MLVIGLTGGIASGKSLVLNFFSDLNIPVIDADQLAREVVCPGSKGLSILTAHFNRDILLSNGELDRAKLRQLVFSNPSERAFLDKTLHPLIRTLSEKRIDSARDKHHPYLVYAVPLLFETYQQNRFDKIIVVDVPVALQLERIQQRDGSTITEANSILDAQASRDQRLSIADYTIDNTGSINQTRKQVETLHQVFIQSSKNCGL